MSDLDNFLNKEGEEPATDAPPPEQQPPEAQAAPEEAKEEPEGEGNEPTTTAPDGRMVPLSALEKVRTDWKIKATKAETEAAELRRQLEEFKRAPPAQPAAPPPPINPAEDPQGFLERTQSVILNERLNTSEMIVRDKLGDETVEQAIATFKEAAQADPSLFPKLYSQPNPYAWLVKQAEAMRLQREIGDDPAAYKARLRAELEAEIRGAGMAAAPQQSPVAGLPPSLATARSAAPRSAPAFSGPTPLEDIFRR